MRSRISGCRCRGVSSQIRRTASACTGGWQIPVVCTASPGAASLVASHHCGPGKYGSAGSARNTICGTRPDGHCAANSCSSSKMARPASRCAHPIAMNALSQLHWCGYRCGDARVHPPASLPCNTPAACSRSSARSSSVTLTAPPLPGHQPATGLSGLSVRSMIGRYPRPFQRPSPRPASARRGQEHCRYVASDDPETAGETRPLFFAPLAAIPVTAWLAQRKFLRESLTPAFSDLIREPEYTTEAGFLHLFHRDMKLILEAAGVSEDKPLVIFFDDLDRCSFGTVAEVVEGLNLFLAGQFPHCVFVIGMEPTLVAAQLAVAY